MIRGSLGCHLVRRASNVASSTATLILLFGISIEIISPSSIKAIGPPTAASGDTCPIDAPLVAPEKRPSVINATSLSSPIPAISLVGDNISLIPGPPLGPS